MTLGSLHNVIAVLVLIEMDKNGYSGIQGQKQSFLAEGVFLITGDP